MWGLESVREVIGEHVKRVVCGVAVLATLPLTAACGAAGSDHYTLYRSDVGATGARIHVATFDANEREAYNRDNCELARSLFQQQPTAAVKYWCEKGRYRK